MAATTVFSILLMAFSGGDYTVDDDETLEFFWNPASGNVDHYDVYFSVNGGEFEFVGSVSDCPTEDALYALPIVAGPGDFHVITVQAVGAAGSVGQMSESCIPVWRRPEITPERPTHGR